MTFDGVITIASILGILGFFLSVVNYLRLKPAIVLIGPKETRIFRDDVWKPYLYVFEIQNAGASGVSLSSIQITSPGEKAFNTAHISPPAWFIGLKLPLRLDAYDVYALTLDVDRYQQSNYIEPSLFEMDLVVEHYGRASIFRILEWDKLERKMKFTSDTHRRLRSQRIRFNIAPVSPSVADQN